MLNLDGVVSIDRTHDISDYTNLRFINKNELKTPEALTLHEEGILDDKIIKELCERAYGFELYEPITSYVPEHIISYYRDTGAVPVIYMPMKKTVTLVYLPEFKFVEQTYQDHKVEYLPTTIYYYLRVYQRNYGVHKVLKEVPAKTLFDGIVKEAINLGAADITITNVGKTTEVYYNVRKRKVNSHKLFTYEFMLDVIKLVTIKSPIDYGTKHPKYVDIDLNKDYRCRVVINSKFGGHVITMRLLPNAAFNSKLEELNLSNGTCSWLRENFLDGETGLRLLVGATMSGKNTTALAVLSEIAVKEKYKIISIERPVEQELPGVEQINTENIDEYVSNIKSLIHQNPDFVYVTEIQDATGLATVQITNTGKCVLSTLHSNSVADTISRLVDITSLSQDRIIQSLHSICYQELNLNEETKELLPHNRYVRFTNDLKYQLYGKSLGEALKIIRDNEGGDTWTYAQFTKL